MSQNTISYAKYFWLTRFGEGDFSPQFTRSISFQCLQYFWWSYYVGLKWIVRKRTNEKVKLAIMILESTSFSLVHFYLLLI